MALRCKERVRGEILLSGVAAKALKDFIPSWRIIDSMTISVNKMRANVYICMTAMVRALSMQLCKSE